MELTNANTHKLGWIKQFTIGTEVFKKLENLNLIDELSKVTFNPLVDNDNYHWDGSYKFEGDSDDIAALVISNLCHCEYNHEFGEVFLVDWFSEAMIGGMFDDERFKTFTVTKDIAETIYSDHSSRRIKKAIHKFEVDFNDRQIPVYIGTYSFGQGGDPTYLIFNKRDLPALVTKALNAYHLCTYINDRISERVLDQVKSNEFNMSTEDPGSLNSILFDLLESLEVTIPDWM